MEQEQQYLLSLVDYINKQVHKKQEKYSRCKWISDYDLNKLSFRFEDLDEYTAGNYNVDTHEICINSKYLQGNILNPKMNTNAQQKRLNKDIIRILQHELCHYYCNELFYNKYIDYTSDASPIFIMLNYFINPFERNAYSSFEDVENSKAYWENVWNKYTLTLNEMLMYLMNIIIKLNDMQRKYPMIYTFGDPFKTQFEGYTDEDYYIMNISYEKEDISNLIYKDANLDSLEQLFKSQKKENGEDYTDEDVQRFKANMILGKQGKLTKVLYKVELPRELYYLDEVEEQVAKIYNEYISNIKAETEQQEEIIDEYIQKGLLVVNKYVNQPLSRIDLRNIYLEIMKLEDTKKIHHNVMIADIKQLIKSNGYRLKEHQYYNSNRKKVMKYYVIYNL